MPNLSPDDELAHWRDQAKHWQAKAEQAELTLTVAQVSMHDRVVGKQDEVRRLELYERIALLRDSRDEARAFAADMAHQLADKRQVVADLREQVGRCERDWDALVKLIAQTVGTDEDMEAAEMDELAEFDPWHALRTRAAEAAKQLSPGYDCFACEALAWLLELLGALNVQQIIDEAPDESDRDNCKLALGVLSRLVERKP